MEKNPEINPPISCKRWKSIIYKNREEVSHTLVLGITELMQKAERINLSATSLRIIYTRTSVYNNRPYYRIYLFDKKLYNGNTDCWVYWEMPDIIRFAERRFPIVKNPYQSGYKLSETVMEEKRVRCAENLYIAMREIISYFLNYVYLKLPQIKYYSVFFGEYIGEQKVLFEPEESVGS